MAKRAPEHLDAVAKQKWRELRSTLPDDDPVTLDLMSLYCSAWSSWLAANTDQDRIKWMRAVRQLAGELNLTPRGRSRCKAVKGDPIAELIRKAHNA